MPRCRLVAGVGAALLALAPWSVASAQEPAGAPTPMSSATDPHKGQWGGRRFDAASGLAVSGEVVALPHTRGIFEVVVEVRAAASEAPLAAEDRVTIHLHPSFTPSVQLASIESGVARLRFRAWRPFTVGVLIERADERIRLELDLATVPSAPRAFRAR
ncbi:MAG: pYEATS domain-containing protein [Acidobacteriota bacterium]